MNEVTTQALELASIIVMLLIIYFEIKRGKGMNYRDPFDWARANPTKAACYVAAIIIILLTQLGTDRTHIYYTQHPLNWSPPLPLFINGSELPQINISNSSVSEVVVHG